ncbi:ribosomal protein S2, partial [Aureobasidium sp. EXF-3399]
MILRSIALRQGRRAVAKPARCLHSSATCLQHTQSIDPDSYSFSSRVQPPVDGDQVARDYRAFKHHQEVTNRIGSVVTPKYQPHKQLTQPPSADEISLELLLASQSHLGHSTSLWNPANARYIFGVRQGIHIISLDQTASHLRRACAVVRGVAQRGGLILFVGTREGQERIVVKAAELAGGCHLFDRWIPGSITNGAQILGRCRTKVVDENDKEIKGFEEQLEAKGALKPDLVVCLNPRENYVLLHECGLNNIPTIGVIDTDANPTWVTYPIPANDDSLRCINLIGGVLGRAAESGMKSRLGQAAQGKVSYSARHNLDPPTSDQIAAAYEAERSFNKNNEFDDDAENRLVTSSTPADEDARIQEQADITMLSAFEYAQFADFDEDAMTAAFDMHLPDQKTSETSELAELRDNLRRTHRALQVPSEGGPEYLESKPIDAKTAVELEAEAQDMMDEPLTQQEAAALHSRDGGKGENPYEGGSYRSALKMRKNAADATLSRMIALKRQAFGEELSAEDKEVLRKLDEAAKNAPAVDEGQFALPARRPS